MATEILRPNAAGDETAITAQYPSSTAHWDKVDEAVADDDATYVSNSTTTYRRDLYNLPTHSVGSGVINSIRIVFAVKCVTGSGWYAKPSQKSGTTVSDGDIQNGEHTDYYECSQTYTTNPATGNAYTWDEIDSLQIGVVIKGERQDGCYCTQVYVEVDYTAGWAGTFNGIASPLTVNGIAGSGLTSVNGVT
jgi:hypothetical protein